MAEVLGDVELQVEAFGADAQIEVDEGGRGGNEGLEMPYYTPGGEIQGGYDTPLDLGGKTKHKIKGGEITEY